MRNKVDDEIDYFVHNHIEFNLWDKVNVEVHENVNRAIGTSLRKEFVYLD